MKRVIQMLFEWIRQKVVRYQVLWQPVSSSMGIFSSSHAGSVLMSSTPRRVRVPLIRGRWPSANSERMVTYGSQNGSLATSRAIFPSPSRPSSFRVDGLARTSNSDMLLLIDSWQWSQGVPCSAGVSFVTTLFYSPSQEALRISVRPSLRDSYAAQTRCPRWCERVT